VVLALSLHFLKWEENEQKMDICTFWFGDKLRFIDRLCLASQVMSGQKVKLYSYQPVAGVPEGVELCDAEPILPLATLARLDPDFPHFKPSRTIVQLSDFFRIRLMQHAQGAWLDTDVYLVKPFKPDPDKIWLGRENRHRLGVSALYLPPDNPIIEEFNHYLATDQRVPSWLGFKKRCWIPFLLRMKGEKVQPNRLGITIFGNDGISRLAKKHGFFHQAQAKNHFYYWTGRKARRIFDPTYGLEPLDCPDLIGFHVHKKAETEQPARKGSLFEWMVRRVQI